MDQLFKYWFIAIVLSCAFSCNSSSSEITGDVPFFDLKVFMEEEKSKLPAGLYSKEALINGKSSTADVRQTEIENDLSGFQSFDINKRSWKEKYRIDSSFNTQGILGSIHYLTDDKKLKTRQLKVYFDQGKVKKIEALNETQNVLYSSIHNLVFNRGLGYELNMQQKVVFFRKKNASIKVRYPEK